MHLEGPGASLRLVDRGYQGSPVTLASALGEPRGSPVALASALGGAWCVIAPGRWRYQGSPVALASVLGEPGGSPVALASALGRA